MLSNLQLNMPHLWPTISKPHLCHHITTSLNLVMARLGINQTFPSQLESWECEWMSGSKRLSEFLQEVRKPSDGLSIFQSYPWVHSINISKRRCIVCSNTEPPNSTKLRRFNDHQKLFGSSCFYRSYCGDGLWAELSHQGRLFDFFLVQPSGRSGFFNVWSKYVKLLDIM